MLAVLTLNPAFLVLTLCLSFLRADFAYAQTASAAQKVEMLEQLIKIKATAAWTLKGYGPGETNFGAGVTVAVIDTGVNGLHADLVSSMAINFKEIPGNKIDDDKNGYVDDVFGWDFVTNTPLVSDPQGHGTHVAGIIAGKYSGVAPRAKIIPIRVMDEKGQGNTERILKGIFYAVSRGAKIINLSLGGLDLHSFDRGNYERIVSYARSLGVFMVVSAGNDSLDNDKAPVYPANVWDDNLITVCSVGPNNFLSLFSNYGNWKVHLCAPGEEILSAGHLHYFIPYKKLSGTSMAAPFVTGAAALVLAANPELKPYQIRNALMEGADRYPSLIGLSQTGGVLNVKASVNLALKLKLEN